MGSKYTYRLINPYITGSMNNVVRSSDSFRAGKKFYNGLSQYFTNKVDEFYMTVQNIESGKLSHFKINEKVKDLSSNPMVVDFNMVRLNDEFSPELQEKIIDKYTQLNNQQSGGKSHKKSHRRSRNKRINFDKESSDSSSSSGSDSDSYSSSSSSSSDEASNFGNLTTYLPITTYKYFLLPYNNLVKTSGLSVLDSSRIFIPSFSFYVNPSIEIIYDIYKY